MFTRRRTRREPVWNRGKLVAMLAGAAATGLLVVVGLGLFVFYALHPADSAAGKRPAAGQADGQRAAAASVPEVPGSAASPAAAGSDRVRQDALASAPMPVVDPSEAQPGPVSTRNPGLIRLPGPTRVGPAGVPTGFPRTPEGALAQLAAIDQAAMQSGSLAGVREVIAEWAAPGGPTQESWSAVEAMASFLDAAGLSSGGSAQLALSVTPMMGMIKGTVGPDFVVPCVNFEFAATMTETVRVAASDCQRMVWDGRRWLIGPGPEPAPAPDVWPGTETAVTVGYKDLRRG